MSEEPRSTGSASPDGSGAIPEARPAAAPGGPEHAGGGGGPGEPFGPRPIFEIEEDRCPKCGIVMPSAAVVCMKCGYDQRANIVREVTTGVVETAEPRPTGRAAAPETSGRAGSTDQFVQPGRLTPKALAITGGVLTAAAVVCAGVFAHPSQRSFLPIVGLGLFTLYSVAVNTATGVGAVAIAARLKSQPLGRLDLTLARMFASFSLFQAIVNVRPSLGYSILTGGVPFLVGAGAYFGAIMLLFRKDRQTATLIAAAHFVLWILLQLGPVLAGWVAVAPGRGVATP